MTDETELKPCPFCGDQPFSYYIEPHEHHSPMIRKLLADHPGSWWIECGKCSFHYGGDPDKDAVLDAWNRRVTDG